LGRIDNQVKIRGHRIELGEIESVLSQYPEVRESVVLAREDVAGDKRLVGYIVAEKGSAPSGGGLRSFLTKKLPDYMLPSAFVYLEALPLTPNGKVDLKALPAPDQTRPELDETFVAPRTPVEEILAGIWAGVLKLDQVGIHDNFFDLGGHSLLATQIISRIRNAFRIDLPLRALFETPTVAGIAEHLESTRKAQAVSRVLPIALEAIDKECPLSFSQERFWFLDQLQPNNAAYSVAYGFRLDGPLNIKALEQAISEIVTRHETLRTTFHQRNGRLVQVISEQWSFRLSIVDLSKQGVTDMDAEVQRIFESDRRRRFDLSADLLVRATLLRLDKSEHVLILTSHHIAWDHWCIEVFFRELCVLYHAFANGAISPLSALPIQYKHYSLWQRNEFRDKELEHHLAYWKQQLADAPLYLNLPTDYPRKPLQNRRGGRQTLVLPEELNNALRSLSKEAGVTLFMTLLAAFQTLLCRMTGQDDIVVGTPIAGRNLFETEKLIGLFLNTLALRTKLSDDPSFLKLLARVRDVAVGAYEHQDLPFEKLVEALQPDRDLSRTPVFQVFINMYNFKESTLELDRLSVKRLLPGESGEQFDITLSIREHADGMHLTFLYDAELFESATIRRMLRHFETLLRGIVDNPDQRISDLPMLTESERHQLLLEWNDTKTDYPKDQCIHQLFEEQVEKSPDAIAVVFEEQQITYRELNERANQLAHYLMKLGVGAETLVGICVERSIEMIVGLLGILKAGGAYLPLDPAYSKERLAFMLEDAQTHVLLTQVRLHNNRPEHRAHVLCLDRDGFKIEQESTENPQRLVPAESLAYVIYTSGSTGRPKGVMIPHGAICNHMFWMQREFPVGETDRVIQKTPFSFDASVWEFFAPLFAGAQLIMARPGGHQDSSYLVKLIAEKKITVLQLVPSLLQMLLEEKEIESCTHLKRVFCGGEALSRELVERFFEKLPVDLHNLYGPTEASIDSTFWSCTGESKERSVPIGRPIANTEIYLLDCHLQPVPIGVSGELHIGGAGLARGYLNCTDLTAEKFLPNPFSSAPGSRLYKTGDLARYLPDGNIEFLGRIDHQVKIRGFRVELGEIEAVLTQYPAIQQAIAVVREDVPGNNRLVAYIIPNKDQALTPNDLLNFLKSKLPDYMIPSAFVALDALPLNSNGKVDRSALPPPDGGRPELEEAFVAPRTSVEKVLAGIWTKVLKLEKVGIHDNFFELGVHSLLATQVVSRIRAAFQVELPLRSLFEKPTIAELAFAITQSRGGTARAEEIDRILANIESLSDEEAQQLLSNEGT
jgi:amino acid adenylation domain-containing protein